MICLSPSFLFLGIANGSRECRFVCSMVRGSLIWSSVAPKDLPLEQIGLLLLALFSLSVHQLGTIIIGRINYQDAAEADASAAADDATEEEEEDEEADNWNEWRWLGRRCAMSAQIIFKLSTAKGSSVATDGARKWESQKESETFLSQKRMLSLCSIAFSGQWCQLAENESICPLSVPGLQLSSAHSASFPCFAYILYYWPAANRVLIAIDQ